MADMPKGAQLFSFDKFTPTGWDEDKNLPTEAKVVKVFAWYATAEDYLEDLSSAGSCCFGYETLVGRCRLHLDLEQYGKPESEHGGVGWGGWGSPEGAHSSLREVVAYLRECLKFHFGVEEAEIWVSCSSRWIDGKGYKHSYHITVANVHTVDNIVQRGFFEEIFPAGHRHRGFIDMKIYTLRRQMRTWGAEKMEKSGAPANAASKLINITQNPYGDGGEDVYSWRGIEQHKDHLAARRGLITTIDEGSTFADCSRLTPCTRASAGSAPNPATWSRNSSPEA
jgi:hypothetical protein